LYSYKFTELIREKRFCGVLRLIGSKRGVFELIREKIGLLGTLEIK
jgi:hypothetical protein